MRVVTDILSKHSNTSVSIYLNGKKLADTIQTDATIYPSGMLVARVIPTEEESLSLGYTKHYYAGTQRVSSKIGTTENLGDFLQDWITQGLGGPVDAIGSSMDVLENAEEGVVQVYTELGIDPPAYESSPTFIPVQSFTHGDDENEIYWFHPDHLGSTSYITNVLGEVSQHMEYFAFGETFVEEHRSSNNSPYKFNGKELDEETGWYYYGARYYDPRVSVWLSYDPMGESTMTPYQYAYQNPIRYIDPTGMSGEDPPKSGTYIDHTARQITIYRNVYTRTQEDWDTNKGAIAQWESFKGVYTTDDGIDYDIKFEFNSVVLGDSHLDFKTQVKLQKDKEGISIMELGESDYALRIHKENINVKSRGGNPVSSDHLINGGGVTVGDRYIFNRNKVASEASRAHEIGHTFGLIDNSGGVMDYVSTSFKDMSPVTNANASNAMNNIFNQNKKISTHRKNPNYYNSSSVSNNVTGTYGGSGSFISGSAIIIREEKKKK